ARPPADAELRPRLLPDLGIIVPDRLAGPGIDRVEDAVAGDIIERVADLERFAGRIGGGEVDIPDETELVDILVVDLAQRAVALFAEGPPGMRPVGPVAIVEQLRDRAVAVRRASGHDNAD